MELNNSDKIRSMLSFEPNDFYFVEILKRRKDNTDMKRDMVVINNFYIESFKMYDELLPEIIKICNYENARAYIRINKRNYKVLSLKVLNLIGSYLESGDYKSMRKVFNSVAGRHHSDPDKKWIVDIDWIDFCPNRSNEYREEKLSNLKNYVEKLQIEGGHEPMIEVMPTKNGVHIITHPFRLDTFKVSYPNIDVHKDNCTIIYCP